MKCIKQITVVKVIMNCQICKTESLKAVAKFQGIDKLAADEEKRTITIEGVVDPCLVVKQLRKCRKVAEIVSVGPVPPKAPSPPQPACVVVPFTLPPCCDQCQLVGFGFFDDGRVCVTTPVSTFATRISMSQ